MPMTRRRFPAPDSTGYTPVVIPKTRYARASDGVSIAYQVLGDGPRDLVWVPGWISHVEAAWDEPTMARFFERIASLIGGCTL
jgi:hypothetical protein